MDALHEITNFEIIPMKRFKKELQKLAENSNYSEIRIFLINTNGTDKYHMIFKYQKCNVKLIIPTDYPFKPPQIFINGFNFDFQKDEYSPLMNIYDIITKIINTKIMKSKNQINFVPELDGFFYADTDRGFNTDDLHGLGYLYDCHNFENKKYQFGSGFIYSILTQYFKEYMYNIPIETINIFVDRLIDYPLIKELGCVYLVLKIYEESFIIQIENYCDKINQYLISNDVKTQFNEAIREFKNNNRIIMIELTHRLDHLNHILTIYINIWLYQNFIFDSQDLPFDDISYDLNSIIDTFLRTESNSELYHWSMQFIGNDKSIAEFNMHLFLDNYNYIINNLRNENPHKIKCATDFLITVKTFNNFSNDMINIDVEPYELRKQDLNYRLSQYLKKLGHHTIEFPISLVHMHSTEANVFEAFNLILGQDVSKLVTGNFCENIHL